jgi:hypothetical protein
VDSILPALARLWRKKKSGDGESVPVPIAPDRQDDSKAADMLDALKVNALLVALLVTASAVNGLILYSRF